MVQVQRVDMETQLREQRSLERRTTAGPTLACGTSCDQSPALQCEAVEVKLLIVFFLL